MLNSLYGRFGVSPYLDKHIIINSKDLVDLSEKENITNVLSLSQDKELVSYQSNLQIEIENNNTLCNIAIAAAVTAGARVFRSKFKNMPEYTLYYSDTDSIDIDKPLPEEYVGNELGQFKLEHSISRAAFLAPKVYGGIDTNGIEFTKIKGLKSKLTFNQLEYLLNENVSLDIKQEKWFNHLVDSTINVKDDTSYNLKVTNNKRNLIYEKGKLVGTSNKDVSDN